MTDKIKKSSPEGSPRPVDDGEREEPDAGRRARRRALLGTISAAGLSGAVHLPKQWARPVVDHVLLPAHAQISGRCLLDCTATAALNFVTAATDTSTGIVISFTSTLTVVCQRDSDNQTASASASTSGSLSQTETTVPTVTSTTLGLSGSFTGAECNLDLSNLFNQQ